MQSEQHAAERARAVLADTYVQAGGTRGIATALIVEGGVISVDIVLDAMLAFARQPATPTGAENAQVADVGEMPGRDAVAEAACLLDEYAGFIRTVKADELERHPYLPLIEQTSADLNAILAATPAQVDRDDVSAAGEAAYRSGYRQGRVKPVYRLSEDKSWDEYAIRQRGELEA